jgi:hypothetical protein
MRLRVVTVSGFYGRLSLNSVCPDIVTTGHRAVQRIERKLRLNDCLELCGFIEMVQSTGFFSLNQRQSHYAPVPLLYQYKFPVTVELLCKYVLLNNDRSDSISLNQINSFW